ncbi:MAG: DNA polymerase III subunit delta [Spirochaetia bacterium]|nr:DNA polymerase III subunit delta [Spirochaetia bacterium]MCE1208604.1 DNA polymerase III subunit delta [Spirochaetia bacterium]
MPSPALLPTYILAGPEIGRRDLFVREIAEGLAAKEGQAAEYSRFYAQDMPPERLVGFLRNASLFSPRRLIEYRNAEVLSSKQDQESLIAYIRNPAEDAVLLLVTEAYGLARGLEEAVGPRGKKIFWELRDSEKPAWLADRLARDRLAADDDAIETVLELVENETSALDSACTVLAACFPAQHRLSSEDIESALSRSRREDAFSLFDRMVQGDMDSALGVLDALLSDRQSESSQIMAALIWSFITLERLHRNLAQGLELEDAFRAEKIGSKTGQRKFRAALNRYNGGDCARILKAASETEAALRAGYPASFARSFLQLFIRSAMMMKGSGLILSGWKKEEYYPFD